MEGVDGEIRRPFSFGMSQIRVLIMSRDVERAFEALQQGRRDEAVALVQGAAAQRDRDALMTLAQWHMVGDLMPRDISAARKYLHAAVEAEHADAALVEAALTANGSGSDRDWKAALKMLRNAAKYHGGIAAEHLSLLSRMDLDEAGGPAKIPEHDLLGRDFQVRRWRQFLSPEECAHVAMSAQDLLEPSVVADPRTGRSIPHPVRTSSAAILGPTRETLPLQAILQRIASVTQTDIAQGEPLSVLHYMNGQEYREHLDVLPHEQNQRILTAILYLNEGYAGGETRFPEQGLSIRGRGGDLIVFCNLLPDRSPDVRSRHCGTPVTQGVKWAATRWIRQSPMDVWKMN
ncbi:hypothetical protein NRB_47650 [Novosphingobium sp. 11B]